MKRKKFFLGKTRTRDDTSACAFCPTLLHHALRISSHLLHTVDLPTHACLAQVLCHHFPFAKHRSCLKHLKTFRCQVAKWHKAIRPYVLHLDFTSITRASFFRLRTTKFQLPPSPKVVENDPSGTCTDVIFRMRGFELNGFTLCFAKTQSCYLEFYFCVCIFFRFISYVIHFWRNSLYIGCPKLEANALPTLSHCWLQCALRTSGH